MSSTLKKRFMNLSFLSSFFTRLKIYQKKNPKRFWGAILLLLAGILYWIFGVSHSYPPQFQKVVEIERVQKGSIQEDIRVIGTIHAKHEAVLTVKAEGILRLDVEPGSSVQKGSQVARILNEDVDQNLELLGQSVKLAEAQYNRAQTLLKSKAISQRSLEDMKEKLLAAKTALSDATKQGNEYRIIAPFDGVLGIFKYRDGAQVFPQTPLTTIYDPETLIVEFDLPLDAAQNITADTKISLNNQVFSLTHAQKMLDPDTHMAPAYAEVFCAKCVIGETVDVTVHLNHKDNVIVIPFEAIFLKKAKPHVYVVKDEKAVLTPIVLGIRNEKDVEVREGLSVDDQLVVFGHTRLYPDSPVRVAKAPNALASKKA